MQFDFFWSVTELGILLEVMGAVYIVLGSFRAREQIDRIFSGLKGLVEIRNILQNQTRMERNGFLFLSTGLIMQFISGFG